MKTGLFTIIAALLAFQVAPAFAFLQAEEQSLSAVKILLNAKSEKVTTFSAHTVHEYGVGRGVVRAYVSSNGQIFAYTGHNLKGHPHPALLGSFLPEYRAAVRQANRKYGRKPLRVNTPHLRAGISGPQGALHWYVFLQSLPTGVSREDVQ